MFLVFGGTIQNIAFTNVVLPGNTGLFGEAMAGTIKNVYVQVKKTKLLIRTTKPMLIPFLVKTLGV
jgi:hypothetical protein